jgi:adenylate cyclase
MMSETVKLEVAETPDSGRPKRKLTTVLATDCVNFSYHMQLDEEATYRNLKRCRKLIDEKIAENAGRIFHTAGDSVIAEFNSPVEAVNAAVACQKSLASRNADDSTELGLEWRIGIHLDDVIVEGSNIMGCGVNIAARLESQCRPGEILTSNAVRERIQGRVDVAITPDGTRELKNISDSFEVFRIHLDQAVINGDAPSLSVAAGESGAAEVSTAPTSHGLKPKIAVFPFQNMSKHEDSEYLVEGIFRDLITEFSRMQEFDVLSHKTALDFQSSGVAPEQFAKEMGINYYINGTVRVAGPKLRISVDLTDAESSATLWGEKYDRTLEDIFDIQDEIVLKMSRQVLGSIEVDTLQRIKRKPSEKLSSYEWLVRGIYHHVRFGQDHMTQALDAFNQAIAIDDTNARAHALKACTMGGGVMSGWLNFEEKFPEVQFHVKKSLEADENDFDCQRISSALSLMAGDRMAALEHAQRAHRINPNDPRVLRQLASTLIVHGRALEGLKFLNQAFELDPIPQGRSTSCDPYKAFIYAYFCLEDFDSCVLYAEKILRFDALTWILALVAFALKSGVGQLKEWPVMTTHQGEFDAINWDELLETNRARFDKDRYQALKDGVRKIFDQ